MVDREKIRNGFFQDLARQAEEQGLLVPLSDEERKQSRAETVASLPDSNEVWVFAYGSLMWNPAFDFVEERIARIYGYHRSFCMSTPIGRGTPENPGLMLGLDRGGSVQGTALRVDPQNLEQELDIIWSREMLAGVYRPTIVSMCCNEGRRFPGIAFVMRRDHERYTGSLTFEETAERIARAKGVMGRCSDYLYNTVEAMDAIGVADGIMHQLRDRVRELQSSMPVDEA